jgi:hypothetical protein
VQGAQPFQVSVSSALRGTPEPPPEACPVTQPPEKPFLPPAPYTAETLVGGDFLFGTPNLWTMLHSDGTWWALPYHEHEDGQGAYSQKVFWWNQSYDWQVEPQPDLRVTGRRLDGPSPPIDALEATNAYTPEFGSAILTGIGLPTLGCWEITGHYQGHSLSFVVWVAP